MSYNITSGYNGDVLEFLYSVTVVGNDAFKKGAFNWIPGIPKKKYLPQLSISDNPIGDYTSDAPTSETVNTTYSERFLEPKKMMLYEEFLPEDLFDLWEKWQPQGDFTNLRNNPEFQADVLALYMNKSGDQLARLFWQGDTSLAAGQPLNKFDGIITRAEADANVVKTSNSGSGVISKANVVDIIETLWSEIPDKFMDDPDYKIHMNTTDYKLLQLFNNDAKKTTVGVLSESIQDLFLEKRIVHYSSFPKNYVLGAKGIAGSNDSNLFMGSYVSLEGENPLIDKKENSGKKWFVRVDWKHDANYRTPSELLLYMPNP